MKDDAYINQPAIPGANAVVTWLDTGDGTYKEFAGFTGDLVCDQPVTVKVKTAAQSGGDPQVMNGNGAGVVVPANTPADLRVAFLGFRTVIDIETGDDAPTLWHLNGRVTKQDVGQSALVAYGTGAPASSNDGKVKISDDDAVAKVLSTAIVDSDTVTTEVVDTGGNKTLKLHAASTGGGADAFLATGSAADGFSGSDSVGLMVSRQDDSEGGGYVLARSNVANNLKNLAGVVTIGPDPEAENTDFTFATAGIRVVKLVTGVSPVGGDRLYLVSAASGGALANKGMLSTNAQGNSPVVGIVVDPSSYGTDRTVTARLMLPGQQRQILVLAAKGTTDGDGLFRMSLLPHVDDVDLSSAGIQMPACTLRNFRLHCIYPAGIDAASVDLEGTGLSFGIPDDPFPGEVTAANAGKVNIAEGELFSITAHGHLSAPGDVRVFFSCEVFPVGQVF
jgi:hypothetical protein